MDIQKALNLTGLPGYKSQCIQSSAGWYLWSDKRMKLKGGGTTTVKAGAFSKPKYKTIFLGFSPKMAFWEEKEGENGEVWDSCCVALQQPYVKVEQGEEVEQSPWGLSPWPQEQWHIPRLLSITWKCFYRTAGEEPLHPSGPDGARLVHPWQIGPETFPLSCCSLASFVFCLGSVK